MNARIRTSHPRRGAVAILAAFLMIFLVAMVAFAVDMGYLCVVQTQAQAVADAAAMAGANGLTNGMAISYAQSCAALNTANARKVTLPASAVSLGTWNSTSGSFGALTGSATSTANAIKVNVNLTTSNSNAVNLFFSNVLGLSSFNIMASAVASAKRLDVIIVPGRQLILFVRLFLRGDRPQDPAVGHQFDLALVLPGRRPAHGLGKHVGFVAAGRLEFQQSEYDHRQDGGLLGQHDQRL